MLVPQMRNELPSLRGQDTIQETTVGEINIAGLPGVNLPAGYYASGAPFSIMFVGQLWSEADLLGLAFAYEAKTRHRKVPQLNG